jgi:hypothetical protein
VRSNRKAAFIALVGVLVISAITSASASAAFKKEFVIEGGSLPQGITGVDEGTLAWETVGYPGVTCGRASLTGTLEAGGVSRNTVSYSACTTSDANCYMQEPLVLNRTGKLVEVNGVLKQKYTGSGPEEELGIFWYKSKVGVTCSTAGKYKIRGNEECKLPEIGVFAETHAVRCAPESENEHLKWGAKAMTFQVTEEISTGKGIRYKAA